MASPPHPSSPRALTRHRPGQRPAAAFRPVRASGQASGDETGEPGDLGVPAARSPPRWVRAGPGTRSLAPRSPAAGAEGEAPGGVGLVRRFAVHQQGPGGVHRSGLTGHGHLARSDPDTVFVPDRRRAAPPRRSQTRRDRAEDHRIDDHPRILAAGHRCELRRPAGVRGEPTVPAAVHRTRAAPRARHADDPAAPRIAFAHAHCPVDRTVRPRRGCRDRRRMADLARGAGNTAGSSGSAPASSLSACTGSSPPSSRTPTSGGSWPRTAASSSPVRWPGE